MFHNMEIKELGSCLTHFEGSEFGPPKQAGVYVVLEMNMLTGSEVCHYIGRSRNIYKRVMNPCHIYRCLHFNSSWPYLIYTKWIVTDDFIEVEKRAIRSINPIRNIAHNG